MGEHSLEDCPIMFDPLNKRRNVNVLSHVPKNNAAITKNLQVVTRKGTNTGINHSKNIQRDQEEHPNLGKHKKIFNIAS